MKYLENFLKTNHNTNTITLIGIDGLGGSGKTTYATQIFNFLTNQRLYLSFISFR